MISSYCRVESKNSGPLAGGATMNALWQSPISRAAGLLVGALVAVPAVAAAQASVTFAKDVAPILQRNCQVCHRPGAIAPMSLLTYEDARPWARAMKEKVVRREMPPWYIDRNIGIAEFKDDPSLSDEDIATISKWVDGGAPMGNPADMPPPRNFS